MPVIRFIDPSFKRQNPSTQGLVDVVGALAARGWVVEVFACELDPGLIGVVTHRKAPCIRLPFGLGAWAYFCYYHWQGIMDRLRGRPRAAVTVATGFMYLPADFATVHFSHFDYLKAVWQHGRKTRGLLPNLLLLIPGFVSELFFLWNPWKTRLLPVSESVAADMRRFAAPWKRIQVLPNPANIERFSTAYREATRVEARRVHGFHEEEKVLLFASAGHHFRKGFLPAVETVARLRARGLAVRFLVVGGREATLARLRRQIRRLHPDFEDWMVFSGSVINPEFHFSAADALFFPSLCEAFSLVEIEASALGLPLYLTAHHGSEMILRDGENGRLLPWDIEGMVDLLEREIRGGGMHFHSGGTGSALSQQDYLQAWIDQLAPVRAAAGSRVLGDKSKLLLVGHTYSLKVNREKALLLARHFHVRVCTCDLDEWKVLGREVVDTQPASHAAAYELRRLIRWPRWQKYTNLVFCGLHAEIADFQPDIILVENEPWSWLRWQARWAAWRAAPAARFAEFTWENVERHGIKGWLLRRIYQAAAVTGGQVICGNQAARKLCIVAGFAEDQCAVAPQLGINLEDYPHASVAEREDWRSQLGWPTVAKVIGFCGRLVEEKGLLDLVEAVRSLRGKNSELCLALVGEGTLRAQLEAADPAGEWLKILPAVPHEEVPDFLNKLDLFILPSKPLAAASGEVWEEQFGHILIEAMACGVLTLGSTSGAIPEVLDDPSVLFPHSDSSALAALIDHWLVRNESRAAKAAEQRGQCAQRWTHEAVALTYADFLKANRNITPR
jgi:glycosyltransferase involved in cell wall biosynthesis